MLSKSADQLFIYSDINYRAILFIDTSKIRQDLFGDNC